MRRFDPEYAAMKQLLDSGELGRTLLVHNVHRNKAVPEHVPHRDDRARLPGARGRRRRWLFGEEIAGSPCTPRPRRAWRRGRARPADRPVPDGGGGMATTEVFVNCQVGYEVRCEAVAERGNVTIGLGRRPRAARTVGTVARAGRLPVPLRDGLRPRGPGVGGRRRRRGEIAGPTAWDGYAAAAVCEAGVESLARGRPVEVEIADRRRRWRCPMKLALDPYMFRHVPLLELPSLVAELGYEWIELSPREDFIAVLQPPSGGRRDGRGVPQGRWPRPGSGSPRCCRSTGGPARTRTTGRPRSGTGNVRSRSPPSSASTR